MEVTAVTFRCPPWRRPRLGDISRLPVSIRIVLESVLRNCDGSRVTEQNVRDLVGWKPRESRVNEIPFVVSRIVLQDFTECHCWWIWQPCVLR